MSWAFGWEFAKKSIEDGRKGNLGGKMHRNGWMTMAVKC